MTLEIAMGIEVISEYIKRLYRIACLILESPKQLDITKQMCPTWFPATIASISFATVGTTEQDRPNKLDLKGKRKLHRFRLRFEVLKHSPCAQTNGMIHGLQDEMLVILDRDQSKGSLKLLKGAVQKALGEEIPALITAVEDFLGEDLAGGLLVKYSLIPEFSERAMIVREIQNFKQAQSKPAATPKTTHITDQNVSTNTGIAFLGGKRTWFAHSIC